MKLYYDFHIHTALSPCGDEDMTPNNIVNMSILNELDCIAITDHNAFGNAGAVIAVGQAAGLLVIPGMEVETSEEIHVVCLFPDLQSLSDFGGIIQSRMPKIKNKPHIYGRQLFLDAEDEIAGEYDNLLIIAASIDIYELAAIAWEYGGVAIPAHIDREANSIMTSLGYIPSDLDIGVIEISKSSNPSEFIAANQQKFEKKYFCVQSSDAHYLGDINERINYIEFDKKPNTYELVNYLRSCAKQAIT